MCCLELKCLIFASTILVEYPFYIAFYKLTITLYVLATTLPKFIHYEELISIAQVSIHSEKKKKKKQQ